MFINKIYKNKLYLSTEEIIDISPFIRRKYNLKIGNNIEQQYDSIIYDAAFEKGIFLLSLRDRTKKELLLKLKEKYNNFKIISEVVNKLEELEYINDLEYAINFIKNKKYGFQRISFSLHQKGIDNNIIHNAYNFLNENKDIDEKKLENAILKNINKEKEKLIQYLMRQGFKLNKILYKLKKYEDYGNFLDEGE